MIERKGKKCKEEKRQCKEVNDCRVCASQMCLYLAVADHLVDVVAYCVCRVLELSMFTFMMMCTTAKAKLLATTNYYSHRNRNNNALMLVEQ